MTAVISMATNRGTSNNEATTPKIGKNVERNGKIIESYFQNNNIFKKVHVKPQNG